MCIRDRPMRFQMVHENYNVKNLERSMEFYKNALGITEKRRIEAPDGSFIIVYPVSYTHLKRVMSLPAGKALVRMKSF